MTTPRDFATLGERVNIHEFHDFVDEANKIGAMVSRNWTWWMPSWFILWVDEIALVQWLFMRRFNETDYELVRHGIPGNVD